MAQLGPELRYISFNRSCTAEAGPRAIQMEPNLKTCDAHGSLSDVHSGVTWGPLWRQLCTKLGPTDTEDGGPCSKRGVVDSQTTWKILVNTGVSRISDWAGYVPIFRPYGLQLGAEVAPKCASWGKVEPSGSAVEPSGPKLGRSWGLVGRS